MDFSLTFARFRYPQYPDMDMGWGWMFRPCGHFTQEPLIFMEDGSVEMLPLRDDSKCYVDLLAGVRRSKEIRN